MPHDDDIPTLSQRVDQRLGGERLPLRVIVYEQHAECRDGHQSGHQICLESH